MTNEGCFSFEVNRCLEAQNVHAGFQDVQSCVIMAYIAQIIQIILRIDCEEVQRNVVMMENGDQPGYGF